MAKMIALPLMMITKLLTMELNSNSKNAAESFAVADCC